MLTTRPAILWASTTDASQQNVHNNKSETIPRARSAPQPIAAWPLIIPALKAQAAGLARAQHNVDCERIFFFVIKISSLAYFCRLRAQFAYIFRFRAASVWDTSHNSGRGLVMSDGLALISTKLGKAPPAGRAD